jgi:exonuclease SbcD
MKILHTSDWHVRDKDIEECEKCLSFLIQTAKAEKVSLVIIAGDMFDSQDVKLDSKAAKLAVRSVSDLANICPVAVLIGTPSHDGMAPIILSHVRGEYPILVADKPMQASLIGDDLAPASQEDCAAPDLLISLIPQPTKQYFQSASGIADSDKEIGAAMSALFAGFGAQAANFDAPHILVGHWNVAGSTLSNGQTLVGLDIEIAYDQMMMANPALICLGHIHKAQRLGDCAFYSGSLYHQSWGEMENKGFWIHEVREDILDGSWFVETPTKKMVRFKDDFTTDDQPGPISLSGVAGAFVRYDVTIWQEAAAGFAKEEVRKAFMDAGALDVDIRFIRVPRHNVRSEAVLKTERLRDKIQKMAELKGEEVEWSVLSKAESLEGRVPEELIEAVGRAAA